MRGIAHPKQIRAAAQNILCAVSFLVCLFFTSAWLSLPEYPVVYSVKELQDGRLQQLCELFGFANLSALPCPGGGFVPSCPILLLDSQTKSSCSVVEEIKPLKMTKFFFFVLFEFSEVLRAGPQQTCIGTAPSLSPEIC